MIIAWIYAVDMFNDCYMYFGVWFLDFVIFVKFIISVVLLNLVKFLFDFLIHCLKWSFVFFFVFICFLGIFIPRSFLLILLLHLWFPFWPLGTRRYFFPCNYNDACIFICAWSNEERWNPVVWFATRYVLM